MSVQRTRPQYVFIDVKRSSTAPSVAPSSPQKALCRITVGSNCVTTTVSYAGTSQEIRLTGSANADNYSFAKITVLEEVLKLGFKQTSNISDDFLILSGEVMI